NKSLKTWEVLSNGPDMHSKNTDTCKLKMDLKSVNKGELLPSMCWRQINGASWTKPPTYCNFFAQALASRIFEQGGYDPQSSPGTDTGWYPWGNESTANSIHDYMISHPELFVDLKWQDCWNYINEGYIVYFVWNNPIGAGHIATGFISEPSTMTLGEKEVQVGKIVQAGTEGMTKIFTLEPGSPWGKEISDVRTFIYLGYLKF
ncbi:MAG: hypothetical protein K2U26_16710, partial [Cyclobacteriaceae bacterium]|nr:hypothetical protein [Cyclobacteriaceae bacterium]